MRYFAWLLVSLITFSVCQKKQLDSADGVIEDYVMRSGDRGDNWFVTWGKDGALYTNLVFQLGYQILYSKY